MIDIREVLGKPVFWVLIAVLVGILGFFVIQTLGGAEIVVSLNATNCTFTNCTVMYSDPDTAAMSLPHLDTMGGI